MREGVNGLMYVLSTGCQSRAIPKDLPPRSTVHGYFDLWSWGGTVPLFITLSARPPVRALFVLKAQRREAESERSAERI